jgi:hypothetical protein
MKSLLPVVGCWCGALTSVLFCGLVRLRASLLPWPCVHIFAPLARASRRTLRKGSRGQDFS